MLDELMDNPWIISIVSSIIGGLFSYALTMLHSICKRKVRLSRQVKASEREIIEYLRTYALTDEVPSPEVIEALIDSSALKHDVPRETLPTVVRAYKMLIGVTHDDGLLSFDDKNAYCLEVASVISELENEEIAKRENAQLGEDLPSAKQTAPTARETASDYATAIPVSFATALVCSPTIFAILIASQPAHDRVIPNEAVLPMAFLLIASTLTLGLLISAITALICRKMFARPEEKAEALRAARHTNIRRPAVDSSVADHPDAGSSTVAPSPARSSAENSSAARHPTEIRYAVISLDSALPDCA